jgi:nucleoid-associated protein YgaU
MFWKVALPKTRWLVHVLIVGTILVMACGWMGGSEPTPTPAATGAAPAGASPSPDSKPAASPSPVASPSPSPSPAAGGETYTVAEGDTLASIAEKFYGDPALWRPIYDANRSAIGDNPDNLKIGTTLRIPPKP